MIQATLLRPGVVIKHGADLFTVFSVEHRTPGNKRGFIQAKMRNLRTGALIDYKFSSEDRVERAVLDEHEMEFLYHEGGHYHFMNTETYEQIHLTQDLLGESVHYLIPNLKILVEFHEDRPVGVELPITVDMEVMETEPALKGGSVSNVMKPAKLETGLVVQVPPFVSTGDRIRVNTTEGTYQERVA